MKKGDKHSAATREKVSASLRGLTEERSRRWLGDKVGYHGLHDWVTRNKVRTGTCEHCGKRPKRLRDGRVLSATEFANVSGEYRRDVDDFIELCHKCHCRYDRSQITECVRGHAYAPENTYIDKRGYKSCKECGRENTRKRRAKNGSGKTTAKSVQA